MQRATTLIRTAAPLRSFATHAARQQLARPQTAGPLAFAARSRGALWVQQTSTQQLQKLHRNSRSLVNDAGAFKNNKDVSYDELKPLTKQPTDDVILIDVREPDEVMMGNIPSSVNVPLSNFEKALDMDDSDFLRAYGFRKPKKDQKMIFYCKAGVRAGSAAGLAKDKGWKNVRNYPGSYDEWVAKQNKA